MRVKELIEIGLWIVAIICFVMFFSENSLGTRFIYLCWSWGCALISMAISVFTSGNHNNYDDNDSYTSGYDQNTGVYPVYYDDGRHSNSDDGRIFDSHGNMINGKLREYERKVRETGVADTEYEQELRDGYRYCDDHADYDGCHYGRDDD